MPEHVEREITAAETKRIGLDEPAATQIAVTIHVVEHAGFFIEVGPFVSQREFEGDAVTVRIFVDRVPAEWIGVVVAPDRRTCGICDQPWRVQVSSPRRAFVVAGSISPDAIGSCSS
jgi:hypothetical protein